VTTRIVALALIGVLGLASAPAVVEAQAANSVRRVGVLRPAPDGPEFRQVFEPFRQALRERGFLEEQTLTIELRVRPGTADQMRTRARELVQLNVDAQRLASRASTAMASRPVMMPPVLWLLGDIACHPDCFDPEQAKAYYRNSMAVGDSQGQRPFVAHSHLGLGRLSARLGKRQEAEEHLTIARQMYGDMEMTFWLKQVGQEA